MMKTRKDMIARAFGEQAPHYNNSADMQKRIAGALVEYFPHLKSPRILEIGCGTGFLTHHLIDAYPDGTFTITDLSPDMIAHCRHQFSNHAHIDYICADGETISDTLKHTEPYDLIISSMALQWFHDPLNGIQNLETLLNETGIFLYATLGLNHFAEWRETLKAVDAPIGLLNLPDLPGVIDTLRIQTNYGDAKTFLRVLKETGANTPKAGYTPMSAPQLRRACDYFDMHYNGCVTWDIILGRLP